jgi:multiple sugar transport system substrate-binding protein
MPLKIALVGGPMYDHIEAAFAPGEVEIIVKADHPTLNRTVAQMLQSNQRIDVLATHSKYAPSQIDWLTPLDERGDDGLQIDTSQLAPTAVELCTFRGRQWCVPRLIDVRLAWSRQDRVDTAPSTWEALLHSPTVFGFTGKASGAFGMFFELVVGLGGDVFDDNARPSMNSGFAIEALATMATLAQRAPRELPTWQYDEVDHALLSGSVDMAAAWPGGWAAIAASPLLLIPSLYLSGVARSVSYSGCHAWSIPRTCGDVPGAINMIGRLCSREVQALDAKAGSACAHSEAFNDVVPTSEIDQARLELTRHTIANMMITYPSLPRFPEVEDECAAAITAVLRGDLSPRDGAQRMQQMSTTVLARP